MSLETIEINPKYPAKYSVIWLHGLGADGHDFADVVPTFDLLETRFILPHANRRPVTINNGMVMRAWYDISSFDFEGRDSDPRGILDSVREIECLIEAEVSRGIQKENITVVGFSQGGAIALRVGLKHQDLKSILALSTYLVCRDDVPVATTVMPIMMMHGTQDTIVPCVVGQHAFDSLKSKGYGVTFKAYPMQHQLCSQELVDIKKFLQP